MPVFWQWIIKILRKEQSNRNSHQTGAVYKVYDAYKVYDPRLEPMCTPYTSPPPCVISPELIGAVWKPNIVWKLELLEYSTSDGIKIWYGSRSWNSWDQDLSQDQEHGWRVMIKTKTTSHQPPPPASLGFIKRTWCRGLSSLRSTLMVRSMTDGQWLYTLSPKRVISCNDKPVFKILSQKQWLTKQDLNDTELQCSRDRRLEIIY